MEKTNVVVATTTEKKVADKKLVKTAVKVKTNFGRNMQGKSIMDVDWNKRTVKFDLRSERGHVINKLKTLVGLGKVSFTKEDRTFERFVAIAKENGKDLSADVQDLVKAVLKPENVALYDENRDGGEVEFKF